METEAILQFVKIKDARPSLGAVKCLHLKIKLLLQVFRARCAKDNGSGGEQSEIYKYTWMPPCNFAITDLLLLCHPALSCIIKTILE